MANKRTLSPSTIENYSERSSKRQFYKSEVDVDVENVDFDINHFISIVKEEEEICIQSEEFENISISHGHGSIPEDPLADVIEDEKLSISSTFQDSSTDFGPAAPKVAEFEISPKESETVPTDDVSVEEEEFNRTESVGSNDFADLSFETGSIYESLLENNFMTGNWSDQERENIIALGETEVALKTDPRWKNITELMENHNETVETNWLLSTKHLKLFCWPCLLFSNLRTFSGGLLIPSSSQDTAALNALVSHQRHFEHHIASRRLAIWQCKSQLVIPVVSVHDNVRRNLKFFCHFINVICFHRKEPSLDNITRTLRFVVAKDPSLSSCNLFHDPQSDEFSKLVAHYLEPLLISIACAMHCRLFNDVRQSKNVFFIFENSPFVGNRYLISVIIRYDSGPNIRERFVKFFKATSDSSMMKFSQCFVRLVEYFECANKIVGFAYDNNVFEPTKIETFNTEASKWYPAACYVNYYRHSIKSLIFQSLCRLTCVANFLAGLKRLSKLFEVRADLRLELDKDGAIPWDFSQDFVIIVANALHKFLVLFKMIKSSPKPNWNVETISEAKFFVKFLSEVGNRFLIVLFAQIFSLTDDLETVLDGPYKVFEYLAEDRKTIEALKSLRNDKFDSVYESAALLTDGTASSLDEPAPPKTHLQNLHKALISLVIKIIDDRTAGIVKLGFFNMSAQLLPPKDILLRCSRHLLKRGDKDFDFNKLYDQLRLFAEQPPYKNGGFECLVKTAEKYELAEYFPEFFKYARLMQTIPLKLTDSVKNSASSRISLYAKDKRISVPKVDAVLSIEQEMLAEMQKELTFHDQVFDKFFSSTTSTNVQ